MLLRCLLLPLYLAVAAANPLLAAPSAGTIQRITILTSDCENCGMTALGNPPPSAKRHNPSPCRSGQPEDLRWQQRALLQRGQHRQLRLGSLRGGPGGQLQRRAPGATHRHQWVGEQTRCAGLLNWELVIFSLISWLKSGKKNA